MLFIGNFFKIPIDLSLDLVYLFLYCALCLHKTIITIIIGLYKLN